MRQVREWFGRWIPVGRDMGRSVACITKIMNPMKMNTMSDSEIEGPFRPMLKSRSLRGRRNQ